MQARDPRTSWSTDRVNLILGPISSNPWIPNASDLANGTDKWYQLQSKSGKFLTQPTATQAKLNSQPERLLFSAIPAMVGALIADMGHLNAKKEEILALRL